MTTKRPLQIDELNFQNLGKLTQEEFEKLDIPDPKSEIEKNFNTPKAKRHRFVGMGTLMFIRIDAGHDQLVEIWGNNFHQIVTKEKEYTVSPGAWLISGWWRPRSGGQWKESRGRVFFDGVGFDDSVRGDGDFDDIKVFFK